MKRNGTSATEEVAAQGMLYANGARSWAEVDEGEAIESLALARSAQEAGVPPSNPSPSP